MSIISSIFAGDADTPPPIFDPTGTGQQPFGDTETDNDPQPIDAPTGYDPKPFDGGSDGDGAGPYEAAPLPDIYTTAE